MKNPSRFSPPAVGGSSLLVSFCLLCLTILALLSLSTVQAEKRMAESSIQAVADYYAADSQAQEIYARLRRGEAIPGVTDENNVYSYTCPISEHQVLSVQLQYRDGNWQILRWQAIASAPEAGESGLAVWDGNTP